MFNRRGMPKISRNLIIWLVILAVVIGVFFTLISPGEKTERLNTLTAIEELKEYGGDITIKEQTLSAEINGGQYVGKKIETTVPADFDAFTVFAAQIDKGTVSIDYQRPSSWGNWVGILINFLPLILFGALILFMLRQ